MKRTDIVTRLRRFAPNFRPLGDSVITPGLLYRSSSMTMLEESGWEEVTALGVRTLIDLRGPHEISKMPVEPPEGISLLSIPFIGPDSADFELRANFDERETVEQMLKSYRWIVSEQGASIAKVLLALAQTDPFPAVIFCTAGKDRTGIVSALILRTLGASDEQLHRDYAASNIALSGDGRKQIIQLAARASQFPMPGGKAGDALLRADPAYLDAALDEAGPISNFLARHAIGVDEVARLRRDLVSRVPE